MRRKSFYDLEISKERRLWYSEIRRTVTPILLAGSIIFSDEKNREYVKKAYNKAKSKLTSIIKH